MKEQNQLKLFGYLGLLASVMVGIGEFLVHYPPGGFVEGSAPYTYFLQIPASRLTLGHYLMVPFLPLYIFGYYHLYLALKPGSPFFARAVLVLGIFAFFIGGIWVGSRAHLGMTMQAMQDVDFPELQSKLVASYDLHLENLVQILRILVLTLSINFIIAILKGGTLYPKWMAFFNPIFLLLIVFALFFFVRPIGQYLVPTAMNVAHFVLFSASLIALKKNQVI